MTTRSDDDTPPSQEIADTWRWHQDVAAWTAKLDGSGIADAHVCRWVAEVVAGTLADFTPLARVHGMTLALETGVTRLAWQADESSAAFRTRLLDDVRAQVLPPTQIVLALDLRVWVHTVDSPERPSLVWIRYPRIELVFDFDPAERTASITFELTNTLFNAFTYPDRDPNPLYHLNQPLLEDALLRLRARSVGALQVHGELKGKYEAGFLPDRDDY